MGLLKEFKEFAVKGNVVDMAVGVIVGGAFGKIVTSVVNDLLMPPISALMGHVNFADLSVTLREATETAEAITLNYGSFVQTVIDFVIVALCVFLFVKAINVMKRKKKEEVVEEPKAPEPSNEEKLLTEIRDLLKEGK